MLAGYQRVSGTALDGVYEYDMTVPASAEEGTWTAKYLLLVDQVGNSRTLDTAALTAGNFPTTFQVGGAPMPVAPGAPTAVTATPGNGSATVTWSAPDNDGGSPITSYTVKALTSGTAPAQTVAVDAPATSATVTGLSNGSPYTFTVAATNAVGTGPDSAGSAAVTPTAPAADTTPPALAELSWTPTSVDTTDSQKTITVRARVTDDSAGLGDDGGEARFVSPSRENSLTAYLRTATRISGDARDGVYEYEMTVPRYSEQGTWILHSVLLTDAAGNSRTYSASEIGQGGFPTTFEQTGTVPDTTPPVLAELSWSPPSIDTAEGDQTITVRARITDRLDGTRRLGRGGPLRQPVRPAQPVRLPAGGEPGFGDGPGRCLRVRDDRSSLLRSGDLDGPERAAQRRRGQR